MTKQNGLHNPNEHLQIPEWINADYFKDILKKDEPDCLGVKKFTPVAAIPPGENFTSVMLRIHMDLDMSDGSVKNKTYILKTMLEDDKGGEIINKLPLFPKELEMYGKYLPAFEKLYAAAGENVQLAPKCLLTEKKDGRINFVFEDLGGRQYKNVDRLDGLGMAEMRVSMRKLAEFHAASMVYAEINGPYPELYQTGFVDKEHGFEFIAGGYALREKNIKKLIADWNLPDCEKYIKTLPTIEQYWKCAVRSTETASNNLNVLTHGDFWSSNIMFNYKADGAINEALILDYQLVNWNSPAQDLLFFISLSPEKEIRVKEFDHFIEMYHDRLVECLKLLNTKQPVPKLRDLHMDLYRDTTTFYAIFALFNHLTIIAYPSDKDSNVAMLTREDEVGEELRRRIFANPLYSELVKDLYPFYQRRGLFNFSDYDD